LATADETADAKTTQPYRLVVRLVPLRLRLPVSLVRLEAKPQFLVSAQPMPGPVLGPLVLPPPPMLSLAAYLQKW